MNGELTQEEFEQIASYIGLSKHTAVSADIARKLLNYAYYLRHELDTCRKAEHTEGEWSQYEWIEDGNRLWYEEGSDLTLHYWRVPTPHCRTSVYAYRSPPPERVEAFILRGFAAAGIHARVSNLCLNNWNGETATVWYFDMEIIP